MAKYHLTNKSVDDLSKIWDYTYEVWSENQADKYYYELLSDCQELAQNQTLGKNYGEIKNDIFGYISGQHLIFYRILNATEIEITRILHSRMDLKNRIQE
ncbi:type II toxin-antitoxin system RelE/ParE family toxin [Flavobacterium sp. ZS1P14]|uniref:type II toxin-antitoxin system RelE/ParE family toxin n=1 Tax=Flavobacterium sp. ZS1P14 TaxID=3401729 RepID=UPI003AAF518A